MVRRDLITWLTTAALVVLIAGLAVIALNRDSFVPLHGYWELSLIETPEGSLFGDGDSWIQLNGESFEGRFGCHDVFGSYQTVRDGAMRVTEWGAETVCDGPDPVGDAFGLYFGDMSRFQWQGGVVLQNEDASVEFHFESEGG